MLENLLLFLAVEIYPGSIRVIVPQLKLFGAPAQAFDPLITPDFSAAHLATLLPSIILKCAGPHIRRCAH